MFNPRELEGEVDHSFFDSDIDDSRDGEKKVDRSLKAENKNPPRHKQRHANAGNALSTGTDENKKYRKQIETQEDSCLSQVGLRSRVSGESSNASDKVISNADGGDDSSLQFKKSSGTFMAFLANAGEADAKDGYRRSSTETEDDTSPCNPKYSNGRNKRCPMKLIRKQRPRSPSLTSSETSTDSDSESTRRNSLKHSSISRPKKSASSFIVRRSKAGSQDLAPRYTDESEDTVTNVSPLSSPDISPLHSLDLNHTEGEDGEQQQQKTSVPSSGLSDIHQDEESYVDEDECSLSLESQFGHKLVLHVPGGRNRKNYSFTNDEVRRIDRENQRLLRELTRFSPRSRPGSVVAQKSNKTSNSAVIRPSHSALNRQRDQKRIERENQAFLKRLESVKPTAGLKRSEQLSDYHRHVRYLGGPPPSTFISITRKERFTSRTPSAGKGPRQASAAHQSARAASISSDSSSTPLPRPKKLGVAQPAWC
ncbi:cilia- and flagella-associated protein 97 [Aulostomus maculatus]